MSTKKFFTADKKQGPTASNLNQVIDVIQEDISGSATRRKYQTFVTGGIGPGVTSSLYQTVYDQDFTLQTANAVMDMTVGLFHYDEGDDANKIRNNLVTRYTGYQRLTNKQLLFDTKTTVMMREKVSIYRQYAKQLLGDANKPFCLGGESGVGVTMQNGPNATGTKTKYAEDPGNTIMDACIFVNIKRLFARDGVRPETFAMRLYEMAPAWSDTANRSPDQWNWKYNVDGSTVVSTAPTDYNTNVGDAKANVGGQAVDSSIYGVQIIADIDANANIINEAGGRCAFLRLAADTSKKCGIIFYDAGIVVLNLGGSTQANKNWYPASSGRNSNDPETIKIGYEANASAGKGLDGGHGQNSALISPVFRPQDRINGVISGMSGLSGTQATNFQTGANTQVAGQIYIGAAADGTNTSNISTAIAAANGTQYINTTARFYPDLLVSASIDDIVDHVASTRFSSGSLTATAFQNTTVVQSSIFFCRASAAQFNASNNETWTSNGKWLLTDSSNSNPYTYITTVLLYDGADDLVAVAKLNRPIEKNDSSELTIRVRLDF